jgi:hypothetical protein
MKNIGLGLNTDKDRWTILMLTMMISYILEPDLIPAIALIQGIVHAQDIVRILNQVYNIQALAIPLHYPFPRRLIMAHTLDPTTEVFLVPTCKCRGAQPMGQLVCQC